MTPEQVREQGDYIATLKDTDDDLLWEKTRDRETTAMMAAATRWGGL